MGTISNKTIEKLDEKFAIVNGNGGTPSFVKEIKKSKKEIEALKVQVSILSIK